MVRDTVVMKGSQDILRLANFINSRRDAEAEHSRWAQTRYQSKRNTSQLWDDLRDDFAMVRGQPPPSEVHAATWDAAEAALKTANGAKHLGSLTIPNTNDKTKLRPAGAASAPALGLPPGADHGLLSSPAPARRRPCLPTDPLRQVPGTRGLPPDLAKAVPMNSGGMRRMMLPNDRCYSLPRRIPR